jgi:histidinol phosphatase-like PHP family hydrolase
MGKGVFDAPNMSEEDELEKYVLEIYKSRKNILPYKENLIDCFAIKLKRAKIIKEDNNVIWRHLDGFVRNFRKLEKYLQYKGIEITYFNMDTDDYMETFDFECDIPRDTTHPGNYPERDEYEKVAKEYVIIRDMKDMRRRNRLRDRIQ